MPLASAYKGPLSAEHKPSAQDGQAGVWTTYVGQVTTHPSATKCRAGTGTWSLILLVWGSHILPLIYSQGVSQLAAIFISTGHPAGRGSTIILLLLVKKQRLREVQ